MAIRTFASPGAESRRHPAVHAYLRLYRVQDWLHFLPLPLAGWLADPERGDAGVLAAGVLAWALGLAYTSAINQAFDARVDVQWTTKNPVGGAFTRGDAIRLSLPPLALSLAVLAVLSPSGLIPGLALIAAATLYSAPPRLKRVPVVGSVWNLAAGIPGFFFAGSPSVAELPLRVLVALYAVLLLGSQLIHEAQDREGDVAGGVSTIATVAGRRGALAGAMVLVLSTPLVAWACAAGLATRGALTAACVLFAAYWCQLLARRLGCDDRAELKRLRLRYRYSVIALGALAFAATQM